MGWFTCHITSNDDSKIVLGRGVVVFTATNPLPALAGAGGGKLPPQIIIDHIELQNRYLHMVMRQRLGSVLLSLEVRFHIVL